MSPDPMPPGTWTKPEFTMALCPACKKEYAFTSWDDISWWFPHICVNGRSVYTVPKEFLA